MKNDFTPARWDIALLLLIILSSSLVAQVKIKEKVAINPKRNANCVNCGEGGGGTNGTGSVASGFLMPKKGLLQIQYEIDDRFSSNGLANYLTANDRLMIDVRHGGTVIFDTLQWRFGGIQVFSNVPCGSYNTKTHYYNDTFVPVTFVPVQKGDTVQFYYRTKNNPSGTDTAIAVSDTLRTWMVGSQVVGWQFYFATVYNSCAPFEYLQVSAYATDTTLQFITAARTDTVWPTYRNHNTTVHTRNYIPLQLKVDFSGTPVRNHWVKVDSAALVDSGGHSHDGNRPPGKYIVPKLSGSGFDTVATFARQTDSTGLVNFTFIAPEACGIERITAKRVSDTTSYDTLRMFTRVDSLIDLATISSNFWVLTGNSGSTSPGFTPCPNTPIKHYSSHWFYSAKIDSVQKAILFFFKWSGTTDGGGSYLKLGVNDMSLRYGGLFDICSNWRTPHLSHRLGLGVDIDSSSATPFLGGTPVPLTHDQVDELTRIMRSFGGGRANERSIHYEFGRR
jgi:hypothetical protein